MTHRPRFGPPSVMASDGATITFIEQDAPRGLAHAVHISESFIDKQPFVMYLGDNLLNKGIVPFVEQFRRRTGRTDPADAGRRSEMFGVAELDNGKVTRLVEKPSSRRAISPWLVSTCSARRSSTRSSASSRAFATSSRLPMRSRI